jgi:beta-1,4-mannosyl-glycoprotein beta-1,4-N-acetylglucosaminyltransferase
MPIYDCFMFNDEIDVLTFRINYYKNIVDQFVVAESSTSFSGVKKQMQAARIFERSGLSQDRYQIIKYEPSEDMIANASIDRWPIERFARESLKIVIGQLNNSETVLLSDVDEIASVGQIQMHKNSTEIVSLHTPLYYRKANWLSIQGKDWHTFKIGPAHLFNDLNNIRYSKTYVEKVMPGAHLSYLALSTSDIVAKAKNSAHREFEINPDSADELLKFSDEYQIDHLGRFDRKGFGLLAAISYSNLDEVCKNFYLEFPEYFDFTRSTKNRLIRMAAAHSVTNAWKAGIGGEPLEFRAIQVLGAIPSHYTARFRKLFSRNIIKLVKKIRKYSSAIKKLR